MAEIRGGLAGRSIGGIDVTTEPLCNSPYGSALNRPHHWSISPESKCPVHASADSERLEACMALAEDEGTPPEVLAGLVDEADDELRVALAENPSTPPVTLALLAECGHCMTLQGVARNPGTPKETLYSLARAESLDVRLHVAGNPAAPSDLLAELALVADDADVRLSVAENEFTPGNVLAALVGDMNPAVVAAARAVVGPHIAAALGIDASNTAAIDYLRDQAWWDMTRDDPAVALALALSPNA